ncbi:pentalenene synthase [Aspergillus aurantiobrunneus]
MSLEMLGHIYPGPDGTRNPMAKETLSSEKKTVTVLLPDIFISWAAVQPKVNPYYQQVKSELESWVSEMCKLDQRSMDKLMRSDFTCYSSAIISDADLEEYRTYSAWMIWGFLFDDQFDHGHLRHDYAMAKEEVAINLSLMEDNPDPELFSCEKYPLRHLQHWIWDRFAKKSSSALQRRYKESMKHYMLGIIDQLHEERANPSVSSLTPLEHLAMRHRTVAIKPCYALSEYAYGLEVPQYVFDNKVIKELEDLALDIIALENDMVSFKKEQLMGEPNNIIEIYCQQGFSKQGAYDEAEKLYRACYRQWYIALSEMPSWGETVDAQVQQYIGSIQNVCRATFYHSFKSERYFGNARDTVRKTRIIDVLA